MKTILDFLGGNRMKSLYWRTGMMILGAIVASLLSSIEVFEAIFEPGVVVLFGLILGEISKAINKSLQAKN